MKSITGCSNRGLEIRLNNREVREFAISHEDRRMFLGGKGLGLKLLNDRLKPGINPLGERNILAFMMGPLMGTGAPCTGRFAALTKSPLTGLMMASSCGGPFGMAYKTAGYDALLITGSSDRAVYLVIDETGVRFEDASSLWGMDTLDTQQALSPGRKDGVLTIGPAGENQVLYANVATGHRFFGRGGMGAVMGAKKLKAVMALGGSFKILPKDPGLFEKTRKTATAFINRNTFTSHTYRKFGTAANVRYCTRGAILPVNNFQDGRHDQAEHLFGETLREQYHTGPSTCRPCTILCGHKGTHPDGSTHQIPEYETLSLLGSNLGIFDPGVITEWNDLCSRFGLDTISTGGTLAWAMEATEKGLIETGLRFGSPEGVSDTIRAIAFREGFGDALAGGTLRLSREYGGEDFAIQVKGMEIAGYDPRGAWGQGLAYAVANRGGCHLSATMMALEVFFGFLNPYSTGAKAKFVCFLEDLFAGVNSLHTCLFTSFAYLLEPPVARWTPKPLLGLTMQFLPDVAIALMDVRNYSRLLQAVTGIPMTQKAFLRAGARIHTLERLMNTREGVRRDQDTLPKRFLEEARRSDEKKRTVPLDRMIKAYYRLRGYDENGIPRAGTLKRLGLEGII